MKLYQEECCKDIIKNLRNEIDSLTKTLQKTRENGDFGTYKNITQAYEKVLYLYMKFFDDNEPPVFNINSEVKLDSSQDIASDIVKKMKDTMIKSGMISR